MEVQVNDLQKTITKLASTQETLQHKVIRDTLWRTVYIRSNEQDMSNLLVLKKVE